VVSLLSFVASCGLIVFFVWRKTKTYLPGIIGAGIFAATFRLGGAWFDIARGDSLLVALLLLSATLLFCFDSRRSAIAAGVVLALSFLTKQSAAIPLAGLVGWAVLTRERRLVWFAGVASGLVATSWLVLHLTSDGWFTYYVFSLPSHHPLLEDWKLLFWKDDVLGVLAIASFLLAFETYVQIEPTKKDFIRSLGFPLFVLGVTGQVWSSRFHLGMYDNVLMPLHAVLGLGVALALARLQTQARTSRAIEMVSLLALLATFWKLEYPVEQQLPGESRVKQYATLSERLEQLPEQTWIAFHSTPAIQLGKPPRAHWMALVDVQRGGGPEAELLQKSARKWLREKKTPAIVWSIRDPSDEWFRKEMQVFYRRSGRLHGPAPLTGWTQRPTEIWVPRSKQDRPMQRPVDRKVNPAGREPGRR
jgi:hypothetical protein